MAGQPGRSGGPRAGTPGKEYQNRTDLNTQRALPSRQYGSAAAQERSLDVAPLPTMPAPGDPTVALNAPTQRPDEPVTAGLPFGDGPGPEVLPGPPVSAMPDVDEAAATIRALYLRYQYPDLLDLIEQLEREGR